MPLKLFLFIFFNKKTNTLRPITVGIAAVCITTILLLFIVETSLLVLSAEGIHIPLKVLDFISNIGSKISTLKN